jgi:hypothetical protein
MIRLSWRLPGLGDPLRVFVATVVFHVVEIASIALVLDYVASSFSSPLSAWSVGATPASQIPSLGERAVTFALAYVAFLPAFLLAMTSLAVSTTSAFGSPSLLLLHRRYRSWENVLKNPLVVLHGRTNPFHRALVFGIGTIAALVTLAVSRQVNFTGNHLPALLFVGAIFALALISALALTVWLIQVRGPSVVVRELHSMARDVIVEITAAQPAPRLTRLIRWRGVASPYRSMYQEQEDLKQAVFSLAEVGARSLTDRQRFASREAVTALGRIADMFRSRRVLVAPEWDTLWTRDGGAAEPLEDWFERVLVEAFESVLLAAIAFRYVSVASDVRDELARLGLWLTWRRAPKSNWALRRLFAAVENCVDEAVDAKDVEVMRQLLPLARRLFGAVSRRRLATTQLLSRVHEGSTGMSYRAVVTGDVSAVRAILATLKDLGVSRRPARGVVAASVLDLAAIALASRSYGVASVVIDWFITPPATGATPATPPTMFVEAVRAHSMTGVRLCEYVPDYVRTEYFQLSVLLTAARVRQIHRTIDPGLQKEVQHFASSLPDRLARAKLVCQRIAPIVAMSETERRAWEAEIDHFI